MIDGRAHQLSVSNYRSLRSLHLPLDHLAVYLGENGTGKTNIYRALELCHHAAIGDLSKWLARQGGMYSAMWAGELKRHEDAQISVTIEVGDYRYTIKLGFKSPSMAAFSGEPLVKEELLELIIGKRKTKIMRRNGPSVVVKDLNNRENRLDLKLLMSETALSVIPAEMSSVEVSMFRETLMDWRFFHAFRVDEASPIRQNCDAITTTKLDSDGNNLAAVFATLEHIRGDTIELRNLIKTAFNGAELVIPEPDEKASFSVVWPDMPQRQFDQRELSDGTIQFLALCGALLSYYTPRLIVLNEPEASLHPDMMPALAQLISIAYETAQIVVVTHSERLTSELSKLCACPIRIVQKQNGQTKIEGLSQFGGFED